MNPEKFHFAEDEVDWAGIRITKDKCRPLDSHVEAIRNFPVPVNVTDMRSFMALVNQVAPYYAVQPHLQPFRDLLKKGTSGTGTITSLTYLQKLRSISV